MQEYVCGFMFDEEMNRVVLIHKQKPEWQIGRLNGVGGKIEEGETFYKAMAREFKEETGIQTSESIWAPICTIQGKDWVVYFLYTCYDKIDNIKQVELEKPEIFFTKDLELLDTIPNLQWLIPMAIHDTQIYKISEIYGTI